MARRARGRNELLERLVEAAGISHRRLAARVNELGAGGGVNLRYEHTSVNNWVVRGMIPREPVPPLIAAALAEHLGRPVELHEIGMGRGTDGRVDVGLDFPRDTATAVRTAATHWRTVDRRFFLTAQGAFTVGAFTSPVTRWTAVPADPPYAHHGGGRRVGRADIAELWQAAEEARRWDSRYGGGNWKTSSVTECLRLRAAPMLTGTYSAPVGRELFAATAELSRTVGWACFDAGQHAAAQRHLVQALRLARAAGDIETGCYVLTTMSLATYLRGHPEQAADMAEAAHERGKNHAAPRVLGFAKLAQARAHARAGHRAEAGAALSAAERHLEAIRPGTHDPEQLAYFGYERLATDAVEIHRDLRNPDEALRWSEEAAPMSADRFTRAVGIRKAVLATAHLQHGDLDQGLTHAQASLDVLQDLRSPRAHGYLRDGLRALAPWRKEQRVADFVHDARSRLSVA
ncbi:hypothetical protein [Streptomyces beigongshangae]|uniref:hypothetical protein n=1 Tax=Streptomyces beigongshangae TaxID=2841597 RepID=UPI001C84E450|nr:hypothetical protein [Streptomyces sp. REN17]